MQVFPVSALGSILQVQEAIVAITCISIAQRKQISKFAYLINMQERVTGAYRHSLHYCSPVNMSVSDICLKGHEVLFRSFGLPLDGVILLRVDQI